MTDKLKALRTIIFIFLFFSIFTHHASANNGVVFSYDQKNGVFSIWRGKEILIKDAVSYVSLANDIIIKSNDKLLKRKLSKIKFEDNSGKGIKYSYINTTKDGLNLIQHFYQYTNKPYLLVETEITGNQISTNEIVSIYTDKSIAKNDKEFYNVVTPFDNDEFISYENIPLNGSLSSSAEMGILLDRNSNEGLIIGSLDQSNWKSGIYFAGSRSSINEIKVQAGYTNKKLTHDDMPHGILQGTNVLSPKYFISSGKDWRVDMETYGKLHNTLNTKYVHSWKAATPVGWNSWGVIQEKINFENATGNVDYFRNEIPLFRNADGEAFIDLDSFWDNMTPGGMEGDYTKLKEFVQYCRANGLKAGAYLAPFTDWGHAGGPNRSVMKGSNYKYGDVWTKTKNGYHDLDGGRAIDPTHPGTQQRVSFILKRLVECGFEMIKIDFLSHAAIESIKFYDPKISTGMQAYSVGMKHIVDQLDGKMLIYAAISPSFASAKYVHMRRIACDAWNTMEQTQYTLNSISYGWYQTYMYDYIDADHIVFHGQTKEVNKARLLSGIVAGPIILGDDFSKKQGWQPYINTWLQDKKLLEIIRDGKSFRPIGFTEGKFANRVYVKHTSKFVYVAVFNFESNVDKINLDLQMIGLNKGLNYNIEELFDKENFTIKGSSTIEFNGNGAKLYRIAL
jgi:alpha-galactosidase